MENKNAKKPKVPDSVIRQKLIDAGLLKPRDEDAFQKQRAEEKDRRARTSGESEARNHGPVGSGNAERKAARACGTQAPKAGTTLH